jgi:hypothetical protein
MASLRIILQKNNHKRFIIQHIVDIIQENTARSKWGRAEHGSEAHRKSDERCDK